MKPPEHPNPPDRPLRSPDAAQQAALAWFVRCDRGLTPDEEVEFQRWLQADARHATLFNEYDGTWTLLGRAPTARLAAADASASTSPYESADSPARDGASAAGSLRRSRAGHRRRMLRFGWIPLAAAAAAVVLLASLPWTAPETPRQWATAIGEIRHTTLPDGSVVRLNTDSAINVTYSAAERRVHLERGEAHFTVTKDPARPFVVASNGVAVRAIGTAYNVRRRDAEVEVLVTSGRVAVEVAEHPPVADPVAAVPGRGRDAAAPGGTGTSTEVAAGERVLVSTVAHSPARQAAAALRVEPVGADEMQRRLAWQERRLVFASAALGEIVAEFNRHNRHQIVVTDRQLAAREFGGSFRANDHAGFVRMLQENFGIRAETRGDTTFLRPTS